MKRNQDMLVPATLIVTFLLVLPPLQSQAWWLVIPGLIFLILRWHTMTFLLIFAAITYADSWWSVAYFLLIILLLFMRMHSRHDSGNWDKLISTVKQFLLTIPVLLVMMAVMAAAGSQWSERNRTGNSMTGISDSMTPGTISNLVNDNSLAMRVRFESENNIQPESLYWRGLVFEDFDGRTWSRNQQLDFDIDPIPATVPEEERLRYLVTLEPNNQTWLYGLHQAYPFRPRTYRDHRGMIVTSDVIRQRVRYPVTSIPPQSTGTLSEALRERNLTLPENGNIQARLLANNLREAFADDRVLVEAVLAYFNQHSFFYTLTPALNGEQKVDDFLFNTREGFCEHYAGAMAFLLRAAGIPARVVAGYLGGSYNNVTGHWQVAQYNAHAWVEAWIPGEGWQRFDPTAAVAPERVINGLDAWLSSLSAEQQQMMDRETRLRLFMASVPGYRAVSEMFQALQYTWNLSMYDGEGNLRTEDLSTWLQRRGLENLPVWLLVLLLIAVGLRAMMPGWGQRASMSPAIKAYLQLNKSLKKKGLDRKHAETITAHLHRVAQEKEDLADKCDELATLISASEYGEQNIDAKSFKHKMLALKVALKKT